MVPLLWWGVLGGCELGLSEAAPDVDESRPVGDSDTATGPGETTADLAGVTWITSPTDWHMGASRDLGELLLAPIDRSLLIHVTAVGERTLTLYSAIASANGNQNPCEEVRSLGEAYWLNPKFVLAKTEPRVSFGGLSVTIHQAAWDVVVSEDGTSWTQGSLSGIVDTRQLGDAQWCDDIAAAGGDCDLCDSDGVEACVLFEVDNVLAFPFVAPFDPDPPSDGC